MALMKPSVSALARMTLTSTRVDLITHMDTIPILSSIDAYRSWLPALESFGNLHSMMKLRSLHAIAHDYICAEHGYMPPFCCVHAYLPLRAYMPNMQARGTTMLCLQSRIQNHTRHQALHTEVGVARVLQSRDS